MLRSRDSLRKRKLQDIRISPEPVPSEDVFLRGESDDDSDETRAWKKIRREAFAFQYLEHGWVPIMMAKLRGPFENGWKNPWANKKARHVKEDLSQYEDESPSPTVRRVTSKIAKFPISNPVSRGFQLLKAPSRTELQNSNRSKLLSSASYHRGMPMQSNGSRHKKSPAVLPLAAARLGSPSPRLHKQLRGALPQESVQDPPSPCQNLEIDRQIQFGQVRSPDPHRLSYELFKNSYTHTKSPNIDGFANYPKSNRLEGLRPSASSPVTRTNSRDYKPESSRNQSEQVLESTLHLEGELKQLWNSANVSDLDGLSSVMEWQHTEAESHMFDGSKVQHQAKIKRVMVYGLEPIILEDGRVNRFSNRQLKDIRTKLSNGLVSVQQRFDTIKAAQHTSDIIACCEITLQLAQTLEKVDYVRRLLKVAKSLPGPLKSGLETYTPLNEHQDHSALDSLSDFTESSNVIDDDGSSIKPHDEAEKKKHEKRTDLTHDAQHPLAKQIPDVLMNRDVVLAKDTENPLANMDKDKNDLSIDSDAEREDRNNNSDSIQGIDSDEPVLADITLVKEVKSPVIKSLGDGVSRVEEVRFVHSGPTQANTPDNLQLLVSSSQELQVPRSPDKQKQQQSLAKTSPTSTSFKQPEHHLPVSADSSQPEIVQATTEVRQETGNNHPLSSVEQNHNEQSDATHPEQPVAVNNNEPANTGTFVGSGTQGTSTEQGVTVIFLDSDSDSSENDAQHQSAPRTVRSHHEETLHSTLEIGASDIARTMDSIPGNENLDAVQVVQPPEPTNSQSRIEQFTNYLQDIHLKAWKKTVQMIQKQPENHLPSNSHTAPLPSAKINIPQGQSSDRNSLPDSLGHFKPIEKSLKFDVQQITQPDFVSPIENQATKRPFLASQSMLGNGQPSSQGVYVSNASSDPRLALENRAGFFGPTEISTTSASTIQPPSGMYQVKLHPASQPLPHNKSHHSIDYSRPMSKGTVVQKGLPQTSSDAASTSSRLHGMLQRSTETSLEDAQRRTPPITESEERDALDAASSLLGIWDLEKEASSAARR